MVPGMNVWLCLRAVEFARNWLIAAGTVSKEVAVIVLLGLTLSSLLRHSGHTPCRIDGVPKDINAMESFHRGLGGTRSKDTIGGIEGMPINSRHLSVSRRLRQYVEGARGREHGMRHASVDIVLSGYLIRSDAEALTAAPVIQKRLLHCEGLIRVGLRALRRCVITLCRIAEAEVGSPVRSMHIVPAAKGLLVNGVAKKLRVARIHDRRRSPPIHTDGGRHLEGRGNAIGDTVSAVRETLSVGGGRRSCHIRLRGAPDLQGVLGIADSSSGERRTFRHIEGRWRWAEVWQAIMWVARVL